MASLPELILFLRACYEADNRETGISDLFNTKYRHLRFFDGEEVGLSGTIEKLPLPHKIGQRVQKDAYKFRRDKTLVYAAFPIVGTPKGVKSLSKEICAPLLYFPAEIVAAKKSFFLVPNLDDLRWNLPILGALASAEQVDEDALHDLLERIPPLPWPRETIHSVAAQFANLLPNIDFEALSQFPELADATYVHETVQKRGQLQCLSASAMALLPNSPDTRGVLFELSSLADDIPRSQPLQSMLGFETPTSIRASKRPSLAPSVLSEAQERVVQNCRSHDLSLVIGPPGTGKSHTIASVALDHLANGKSVLIASRMDQAVDVVADRIENLLGSQAAVVRAGRKQHLRQLKATLGDLLSGISSYGNANASEKSARQLFKELRQLDKELAYAERFMQRNQDREIAWGSSVVSKSNSWLENLSNTVFKSYREWQLGDFDGWDFAEGYEDLLESRTRHSQEFLLQTLRERTARLLNRRRQDLSSFLQAIKSRSDGKQQKLFSEVDFSVLLRAFPIWLCKLGDLSSVLPHQKELFDLAILDESTQCDIASCLPLLQRAKRVAIVGDPKQLRHISFLAEARMQSIAEDRNLDELQTDRFHYRKNSILDVASNSIKDQERVVFLNEHFRSLPGIIDFSNQEFYQNTLSIMRQRPIATAKPSVELRQIAGKRDASGRNEQEANAVLTEIKTLIAETQGNADAAQSIGVLCPFRSQVDYLAKHIDQEISFDAMKRHDLLVGTAHAFQGEERDVMFLSLAVDSDSHWASFRFLENPNLLNVAITRARHRQSVFASFDPSELPTQSLFARWLNSIAAIKKPDSMNESKAEPFRDEILRLAERDGWQAWVDYPIAGLQLDLILAAGAKMLAVDLVGYPGDLQEAFSLERYRVLHRSGLRMFPLSYRRWTDNREACVERIRRMLAS